MSKAASPRKIGVFVITGFLIIFTAFYFLNRDKFMKKSSNYILFFRTSVKGLNVGSNVLFNGVPVGKVEKISIVNNLDTLEFDVPVQIKIDHDKLLLEKDTDTIVFKNKHKVHQAIIDQMVEKGLRGRLITQSYLTGQKSIELAYHPNTPVNLKDNNEYDKNLIEIPTIVSMGDEIKDLAKKIPLDKTFQNLNSLLEELNILSKKLNEQKVAENIGSLTTNMSSAVQNFETNAPVMNDIKQIMHNLSSASVSIKSITDYIDRHPEAILKGKNK